MRLSIHTRRASGTRNSLQGWRFDFARGGNPELRVDAMREEVRRSAGRGDAFAKILADGDAAADFREQLGPQLPKTPPVVAGPRRKIIDAVIDPAADGKNFNQVGEWDGGHRDGWFGF